MVTLATLASSHATTTKKYLPSSSSLEMTYGMRLFCRCLLLSVFRTMISQILSKAKLMSPPRLLLLFFWIFSTSPQMLRRTTSCVLTSANNFSPTFIIIQHIKLKVNVNNLFKICSPFACRQNLCWINVKIFPLFCSVFLI